MIRLTHGKFIHGFRIYRAGDVLPDTDTAKILVDKGRAEIIEDMPRKNKGTKKLNPEKSVETPITTHEDDKSDT